jgi:ferrous iron transport protein A
MFTPFNVTGCSLDLLKIGEQGIIIFCKSKDKKSLNQLLSKGITPGKYITVQQKFPSLIIQIENTSLSVDTETARAIYVRIIHD